MDKFYILKIGQAGNAARLDAVAYWGKWTDELVAALNHAHGDNKSITSIGPAG